MNQIFKRILCAVLVSACVFTVLPATMLRANAETVYQLTDLLAQEKIKPLGRTQANQAGTGILTDWPGSGFQMNVSGIGGTLTVAVNTSYDSNWAVLVDGEQVFWERLSPGTNITANIPAGNHTVTVIKESDASSVQTAYCEFTTMSFAGTIENPPAQKKMLIEFIGDSYTCGHGTLGEYEPGVAWSATEHSFLHAFPYYASEKLDADYTIAARGGIGLFTGISTEQGDNNVVTMHDIYTNAAGYRTSEGEYDFANRRQPDVIVVHLGANDGIDNDVETKSITAWKEKLAAFTDLLREKNPDSAIVLVNHRADKFRMIMQLVDERAATDPDLYYFSMTHQTRGKAANTTQYYGHPSAADSQELGEALADFLVERGLVPEEEQVTAYNDINYYAAQTGSDDNAGTSAETAKLSLSGAMAQAKADYPNGFPNGSRLVFNLTGTVGFNAESSPFLGNVGELKTQDGKNVPILVTTNNYNGTKAVLNTNHKPVDTNDWKVYFCHSMTLKDITFQSTTTTLSSGKTIRDYLLYAGYNQIILDNVTFSQNGATPTDHNWGGWIVSAGHVNGSVTIPTEKTISSVTFRNGDYTNVIRVTCVQNESLSDGTTSAPNVHCEIHIQDGAKMGTIHNRYGKMNYGSCTFYMEGGSVNQYNGTRDFSSSAKGTYQGDVNFVMTGGDVYGKYFYGSGNYASVTGSVNNTISGGIIKLRPTANWECLCFGARGNATVGGVNNTITGGNMFIIGKDSTSFSAGIYFGGRDNTTVTGNVVNRITGGTIMPMDGKDGTASISYSFGITSGAIKGELRNEIIGGTFDTAACTTCDIRFGSPNQNVPIRKVVNIIGDKNDLGSGPMFIDMNHSGSNVMLGSSNGCIGTTTAPTAMPDASVCSDEVVISNTIYGGFFWNDLYCGTEAKNWDGVHNFVNGSIQTDIYGGYFRGTVFGAGKADVYGKVTMNLHGGIIGNLYAGGISATVYDGVELNIYDVQEYHDVYLGNAWHYWGGARDVNIPIPQTTGRAAITVNIAPTKENLTLKTPVTAISRYSDNVGVTKSVSVSGGIYPEGFGIEGVTVLEAVEDGYVVTNTSTGTLVTVAEDALTTGTTSVTIKRDPNVAAINPQTGEEYATLNSAIEAAEETGATIRLEQDINQTSINVWENVTLDLNGHTLQTRYFSCFGDVIDGAAGGEAQLKVEKQLHVVGENSYLPLYDSTTGAYRFYKHNLNNIGSKAVGTDGNSVKFAFRLELANPAGYTVLANTKQEDLDLRVYLGWGGMPAQIDYPYSDATLMAYAEQVAKDYAADGESQQALTLTVKGLKRLNEGDVVTMKPQLNTNSGVQSFGDEVLSWTVQPSA